MHGIGNDFVILDAIQDPELPSDLTAFARKVNDRRLGIGGDGLVLLQRGVEAPFRMRMLNPDGSESEMCGNAIRCIHKLVIDHGHTDLDAFDVETGAGILHLSKADQERVRVNMGFARLNRSAIPVLGPPDEKFLDQPVGQVRGTTVSMGNPHLVIFVDDVSAIDLAHLGPQLETDPIFPNRINVHFIQVVNPTHLIQRTWERGAGPTLACGTGACAAAVAAFETGRSERVVDIRLPGGHLAIEYTDSGEVFMTGPAETVFEGLFPLPA